MTIESKCPFRDEIHVCIMGNRYKLLEGEPPRDAHPLDRDGLLYAGHCKCCAKVSAESYWDMLQGRP